MADKPKTVRGTVHGCVVETSEENAVRLGADFVPESKAASPKPSKK